MTAARGFSEAATKARARRTRCPRCERFPEHCDCWSLRTRLAVGFLLSLLFAAVGFAVAAAVHRFTS